MMNNSDAEMPNTSQITKSQGTVPIIAVAILLVIFGIGLFVVGYDQGHMLSLVQGQHAFATNYLHELNHDMRHAAGFPCH